MISIFQNILTWKEQDTLCTYINNKRKEMYVDYNTISNISTKCRKKVQWNIRD